MINNGELEVFTVCVNHKGQKSIRSQSGKNGGRGRAQSLGQEFEVQVVGGLLGALSGWAWPNRLRPDVWSKPSELWKERPQHWNYLSLPSLPIVEVEGRVVYDSAFGIRRPRPHSLREAERSSHPSHQRSGKLFTIPPFPPPFSPRGFCI